MDTLRSAALVLSCIAFAICCLFLNLLGGIALYMNSYKTIGICLLISVAALLISLVAAFFRKASANLISLIFNITGSLMYIYPIAVLNGIPNSAVPRSSIELFTSRIYPAVSVTILLLLTVFADYFSYERSCKRAERKNQKHKEKHRSLTEDEKII